MRKSVYRFSNQVSHNSACTATEDGYCLYLDLERRDYTIYEAKKNLDTDQPTE